MKNKSVVTEAQEIQTAIELINLGARLQVLQEETSVSRERLLKLYKEVKGESPSKGMLPYSTDWFMSWLPNIHSSLFMDIHQYMVKNHPRLVPDPLLRRQHAGADHLHRMRRPLRRPYRRTHQRLRMRHLPPPLTRRQDQKGRADGRDCGLTGKNDLSAVLLTMWFYQY
ncbi:MAG: flagellar transcriptional activator [Gallionellaceae bacterium]|nr:MAG: flagellar transcriptional activator [Gallionellaceae bacterium]